MRTGRILATALTWAMLAAAAVGCGGDDGGPDVDDGDDGGPDEPLTLRVAGGGNNVPDRYTSDMWVHGSHAYTGTWGGPRNGNVGNALYIWDLDPAGAPSLADSIILADVSTVSDVEVSHDGAVLMLSTEFGDAEGLYLYDLADPTQPALLDSVHVSRGLHTATFGEIDGRRYAFTARNAPDPELVIFDVTDPAAITVAATVPIPPHYGIHDTFVRDGIAFVFAWDTGVIIYDVGNGVRGGSPTDPVEISRVVTEAGNSGSPAAHNGWWFHNPETDETRYLFVGQEGPGVVGVGARGDIHVVDVSDLASPRQVAKFTLPDAGAHNFWMDEAAQVLYAAYYNGGVVALDVSGTLSGDLGDRLLARIEPGGDENTYVWSVMLANGSLYASDMLSGLWQLSVEP